MQEETVQPEKTEKSLEEQLADAQSRLDQQREQMLRVVADADNTRKRAQVEAANAQKYALERFGSALLPVLDSLEAAVKSADLSGVELVLRQIVAALDKANIREINPGPGERFDPYRHQAMAAVESPPGAPGETRRLEPNTVVSVMQKGYSLADRVLRPALVTVAKAVENQPGNPISNTDLD